ncbi:hypothetical protein H9Q70_003561 [Fusarium xylarioides]|nr:hypothetical protein H9Q70_003561 [Fusarium xylarioides]
MASPQTCQSKPGMLESCRSCSGPWQTPNWSLGDNFVILLLSIFHTGHFRYHLSPLSLSHIQIEGELGFSFVLAAI